MPARPLIVLGAGGHAKVLIDLLQKLQRPVLAAVELKPSGDNRTILGVPVWGGDAAVLAYSAEDVELVLGLGMPSQDIVAGLQTRSSLAAGFVAKGYMFPPLVHPSVVVGADCSIGAGAQVMAGVVLQASCQIGEFAIINTGARVDHDCIVARGSHIAPGATLGGSVKIGANTLVGIGASIRQGISAGDHVLVGGGSMVIDNIPDGRRWIGATIQA